MYLPKPTNATTIVMGQTIAIEPGAYNLFSSPADNNFVAPFVSQMDKNAAYSDGANAGFTPGPVTYGSDGRTILVISGTDPVTGLGYVTTVGILIQQYNQSAMFNNGHQPAPRIGKPTDYIPYSKLVIDPIDFSGPGGTGAPGGVQVDWSN